MLRPVSSSRNTYGWHSPAGPSPRSRLDVEGVVAERRKSRSSDSTICDKQKKATFAGDPFPFHMVPFERWRPRFAPCRSSGVPRIPWTHRYVRFAQASKSSGLSSRRRVGRVAQPTTGRGNKSITTARYSQPSHVRRGGSPGHWTPLRLASRAVPACPRNPGNSICQRRPSGSNGCGASWTVTLRFPYVRKNKGLRVSVSL